MFLSLHNARQPSVVLSEPHYGVPGLILLPPADAAACWGRVRGVVGSALDYDVTTWPLYLDVAALCADLDLVVSPWVDCAPAFGPAFWEAPHADITTAGVRARAALAQFPEPDASNLQAAVDRYVARAVSDFAHAARSTTNAEAARLANFITYHSQPLNLLLRPLA